MLRGCCLFLPSILRIQARRWFLKKNQHNPEVPDGKAPFVGYFGGYFKENPESRARIVRSAADGDLVYLHVHSTNGKADRGQAVIDIFRVQDGKIVEHWDVIQAVPEQAANSNTMF